MDQYFVSVKPFSNTQWKTWSGNSNSYNVNLMILLCLYFEISFLETGRGRLMWSLSQIRERCPRHSKKWQTPKPPAIHKTLEVKKLCDSETWYIFLECSKKHYNQFLCAGPLALGQWENMSWKFNIGLCSTDCTVKVRKGKCHKMKKELFQISQSTLPETTLF